MQPTSAFQGTGRLGPKVNVAAAAIVGCFALLAVFNPEKFFLAATAGMLLAAAIAGSIFTWTTLGLILGLVYFSPENFIRMQIAGVETASLHRAVILAAIGLTILKHGMAARMNVPIIGMLLIFVMSLTLADIHPKLTTFQMVKSLFAFIVLFAFININYSPEVIPRLLTMMRYLPIASIVGGVVVELANIHGPWGPWKAMIIEWTGAPRLGGMNIPPMLAYFSYVALFICVFDALQTKQRWLFVLAGIHLTIIILSGTRMPTAASLIFAAIILLFSKGRVLRGSTKLHVAVASILVIGGVLVLYWPALQARMTAGGVNVTGRDIIWEIFVSAIHKEPWFGRGLGTGAVLLIGEFEGTTAAHNEYLRLLADAGIVGLTLFVVSIAAWVRSELRFMSSDERLIIVSFLFTFALYSLTDNTVTSPPAMMLILALSLLFARARLRAARLASLPGRVRGPASASGRA